MNDGAWAELGARAAPSWYLDPAVARQKREVHAALLQRALRYCPSPRLLLKTDLFEEAFGEDQILGDCPVPCALACGVDYAVTTTARAARRFPHLAAGAAAADLRRLPFRDGAFDLILSTSSLDHFATDREIDAALGELARVLAPGGVLVLTFDNLWNPLYHALRLAGRLGALPFALGRTPSPARIPALLRRQGLETLERHWLIHNPRGLSTLLFLALRRLLGARADAPIRALLRLFALGGKLPSRAFTASFAAAIARKPA